MTPGLSVLALKMCYIIIFGSFRSIATRHIQRFLAFGIVASSQHFIRVLAVALLWVVSA